MKKKRFRPIGMIIFIFLISLGVAHSATHTVDGGGTGDFTTIQDAVDASASGDTILVYAGTYNEHVTLIDGISLYGSGPERTIIDAGAGMGGGNPAIRLANACVVSGFRITRGYTGIYGKDCSSVIMNNIIENNYGDGGIVLIAETTSIYGEVINNTIGPNLGSNWTTNPKGIYIEKESTAPSGTVAETVIMNNIIFGNETGISPYLCTPPISYNNLWNNTVNYGYSAPPGLNDISSNPLFIDTDYHLDASSPSVDTGNPAPEYNDPDGTRNDMGAYGGKGYVSPGASGFPGSGYMFTSIGKIPVSEIADDPSSTRHGLANVSTLIANELRIPKYTDSPFGGDLWLHGLFGDASTVNYYEILVAKWPSPTEAPLPGDYKNLTDSLTKVKYTINPDGTVSRQYINLGPKTIDGYKHLYQLTREGFWTHIDLRMIWNTRLWANGKYTLKCKAYKYSGLLPLTLVPVKLPVNTYSTLTMVINNSPVTTKIHNVKYDPMNPYYGTVLPDGEIEECSLIHLTDPEENLRFTIEISHADGYLKNYILDARFGKNNSAGVIASDSYTPSIPPLWYNFSGTVESDTHMGTTLKPWEKCAYQFRLRGYSRITNGFHYIISSEYVDHYFIDFDTTNFCQADINGDGMVDGSDLSIMALEYGETACFP